MSKIFQKIKIKLIRSLYIRNPLNIFFGQKIYGNDSGFLSNIIGNYIIKKNHKLKFNFQNLYEKNKNLNYLNKNGFIYFDYKVKDGVIQSLCNEFESEKHLIHTFDLFGRFTDKSNFHLELYDDGSQVCFFHLAPSARRFTPRTVPSAKLLKP